MIYFNIYNKEGRFIKKDSSYHQSAIDGLKSYFEDSANGYTIEVTEESNEDNNVITIE